MAERWREELATRAEGHLDKAGQAALETVRTSHLGIAEILFLIAQGATQEQIADRLKDGPAKRPPNLR